jgi:hypothetical protein
MRRWHAGSSTAIGGDGSRALARVSPRHRAAGPYYDERGLLRRIDGRRSADAAEGDVRAIFG